MWARLSDELEAENDEVKIPFAARWLGRPSEVKARFKEGAIVASSATFAVVGNAVFSRLRNSGLWLLGRRYDVEADQTRNVAAAADGVHCTRDARCALCAGEHRTDKHKCPVEGCCGQRPGVRSYHGQVPGPIYGAVEPVPEEKGGQAGR